MWIYVLEDLYEVLQYLPLGILAAVAMVLVVLLFCKMLHKEIHPGKMFAFFLFAVYVIATVQIAYFSREPGSRHSIDLTLFGTWGEYPQSKSYVIENVIMFIPFGILVPFIWEGMRRFYRCIPVAFACTVSIETMQLLTQRGYCQLDDVVMNTLGAIIGYFIFLILHRIFENI